MSFILAALFCVAKALLAVLAVLVLFALALAVLPIKVRVAGVIRVVGDFEAFLEGEGGIAVGGEPHDDVAVTLRWDGEVSARVLGGTLGVEYAREKGPELALLGTRFPVTGRRRAKSEKRGPSHAAQDAEKPAARRSVPREKQSLSFHRVKAWLEPDVRKRVLATVRVLFRSSRFRGRAHVELGLPDPAVTGMAYAAFLTWSGASGEKWLTFRPSFVENVISVEADGSIRIVALQMAWILGRFLLSRDIRPLWRGRRAGESKKAPILGAHTTE